MDNVECNGTESHIGECQRSSLDTINCVHSEDAGVLCSSELPTGSHACWHSVHCVYASVCLQLQQLSSSQTTVACTHFVVLLQLALSVVTRTVGAELTALLLWGCTVHIATLVLPCPGCAMSQYISPIMATASQGTTLPNEHTRAICIHSLVCLSTFCKGTCLSYGPAKLRPFSNLY